jgi:hypothetical protein
MIAILHNLKTPCIYTMHIHFSSNCFLVHNLFRLSVVAAVAVVSAFAVVAVAAVAVVAVVAVVVAAV